MVIRRIFKGVIHISNYKEYENLLLKKYDEVIEFLLRKYGSVKDDYFREKSYQRFMNGEIKNITKGKYSRTEDGLYCHHIEEIKELNIGNSEFIKENKIPYEYQKRDNLVYCDLIEHTILHVLIAKESSSEYGYIGYEVFLKPILEEWYIEEQIPQPNWMKLCYTKAFLTPEETVSIIKGMENLLGNSYYDTRCAYFEAKQKRLDDEKERKLKIKQEREAYTKEYAEKQRKQFEKSEREKHILFNQKYPKFKNLGITVYTPRAKIINHLYDYKYNEQYKNKKQFDSAMKSFIKEELMDELHENMGFKD
ncbi:hypothetical protein [Kurthia sibirica]|uniref:hypothetical protein n=1 Tax=Kurthia sibirica TaxID=202750 RepID=UPI00116E52C8|nr:hypothetical protein [Kurthia sibirica]GEK33080.1 hypothetical protein KSI01_06130 [Kurthia sibirica]